MKKGGTGGTNTGTGLIFERKTRLDYALREAGYDMLGDCIFLNGERIAIVTSQYNFYKTFLEPRGIKWKDILSKQLLPDDVLFVEKTKTLFIIEKKYQEGEGSVDEKLQTCDFKKKQYSKLVKSLDMKVEIIYLLNDWFKKERYQDSLNYIKETGCYYFFEEIPIEFLGLPALKE